MAGPSSPDTSGLVDDMVCVLINRYLNSKLLTCPKW